MKTIIVCITALCSHSAFSQLPAGAGSSILPYYFRGLEDSAIAQAHATPLGTNEGWNIYKDILFPGTGIEGKLQHHNRLLPGHRVLSCRITGGDAYNNLFFTYTLAKQWTGKPWAFAKATAFTCSMDFYIDSYVDCNVPNRSEVEGLEFIFQQAMPPVSYLWGLQWSKQNVWCYWDATHLNGRARGWVPIPGLSACMLYRQWNHITVTGHRTGDTLYYDTLRLNDSIFPIHTAVPVASLPPAWADNYLQVGFQINGNKAIRRHHTHGTDPVRVLLNEVELELR